MRNEVLYIKLEVVLSRFKRENGVDPDIYSFCQASINSLAELISSIAVSQVLTTVVEHLVRTPISPIEVMHALDNLVITVSDVMFLDPSEARLIHALTASLPEQPIAPPPTEGQTAQARKAESTSLSPIKKQRLEDDHASSPYTPAHSMELGDESEDELDDDELSGIFLMEDIARLKQAYDVLIPVSELQTLINLQTLIKENQFVVQPDQIDDVKEKINDLRERLRDTIKNVRKAKKIDYSELVNCTALSIDNIMTDYLSASEREQWDKKFSKVTNEIFANALLPQLLWMEYLLVVITSNTEKNQAMYDTVLQDNLVLNNLLRDDEVLSADELQALLSDSPKRYMQCLKITTISSDAIHKMKAIQSIIGSLPNNELQGKLLLQLKRAMVCIKPNVKPSVIDIALDEFHKSLLDQVAPAPRSTLQLR
jgi:hypothetical protein